MSDLFGHKSLGTRPKRKMKENRSVIWRKQPLDGTLCRAEEVKWLFTLPKGTFAEHLSHVSCHNFNTVTLEITGV